MELARAEEIITKLALYEADNENPPPSDFEIGRAIRVLGLAEAFDFFSECIDSMEIVDEAEE